MSLQTLNSANPTPSTNTPSPGTNSGTTSARKSTPKISHLAIAPTRGSVHVVTSTQRSFPAEVMAQALRLASLGTPILVVQFFQGGINQGVNYPRILGQNLTWIRSQIERQITTKVELTTAEINQTLQLWEFVKTAIGSKAFGLIVLDELNLAIELNLIPETEIAQHLGDRPTTLDLILTGANMPNSLTEFADQVTHRRN